MGLGSMRMHDEKTGTTWTASPSGREGWVNIVATCPDLGTLESCVKKLMGEYDEWTMIGKIIPRQFPAKIHSGWICVMQIRFDSRKMRRYDE